MRPRSSYVIDPIWQRKFTLIWAACAGAAVLLALPHLVRTVRRGHTRSALVGITEDFRGRDYEPIRQPEGERIPESRTYGVVHGVMSTLRGLSMWTAPHLGLDLGQGELRVVDA